MSDEANIYSAFDQFLLVDTWHTTHPLDSRRFYLALDKVVRDGNFNADVMGAYMYAKTGVSRETEGGLGYSIERYKTAAWAVRGYLEAIGEIA